MREESAGTDTLTSEDIIIAGIQLRAAEACQGWAHVVHDLDGPDTDPVLYPIARGTPAIGMGYRVSTEVIRKGIWRITLCLASCLPAGVDRETRLMLLRAYAAGHGADLAPAQVDQIIQAGIFMEVVFR